MKRKTRSSAKVLRWKSSGPPSGVAAGGSSGAMELVQQELPLKESTAGLRVITVILAVMLLHVLFIGGVALYNLLGGGGKPARADGGGQKRPVGALAAGTRAGRPEGEAGSSGSPSSPDGSLARGMGGKGRTAASSASRTEDAGRKKGSKKRLRRLASQENTEESASLDSAGATERRNGSVAFVPGQNEPTSPALPSEAPSRIYHVARGDTLWRIARRCHVGLSDLMTVNGLSASSKLHIGQELRIPPGRPGRSRRGAGAAGG
ncbi:MAG: LysM peptidoglycan-binding domain-containing protein [Methylacidiphilaceae bacterium]|nr:LysM peptidoglycan-binding domain-containing protein [Candidatus Methylacidiphilaceae bacterium]